MCVIFTHAAYRGLSISGVPKLALNIHTAHKTYIIATSELLYDAGHCMDFFCVVSTHAAYRILFISGASKPALNIYLAHKTDIIATSKSIYDTGHFMDFFCVISTHCRGLKLNRLRVKGG